MLIDFRRLYSSCTLLVCMHKCTHICFCVCVWVGGMCVSVCVRERERERDRTCVIVSYDNPIINLKFTLYHYLRI
jgi:hypothetical protein